MDNLSREKNLQPRKLNVLFINMPTLPLHVLEATFTNENLQQQPLSMPLGILYISSYLKKNSSVGQVGLLDYILATTELTSFKDVDGFIAGIVERNADFTPDILAFSLHFSASYFFFEKCISILHNKWPKAITVCGGVHSTNTTTSLLARGDIDYVVRGEGELSFCEFVNQLSHSKIIHVQGVYSKQASVHQDGLLLSQFENNLDAIPFPDWDLIDMERYIILLGRRREWGKKHLMASLYTTRGCPFHCTFCSSHTVHGHRVRVRSVDNVIQEIMSLHNRYNVTLFLPEDDLFTANKQRILTTLKAIKALNIPGIEIQTPDGLSVSTLDEEVIDALIEAGMKIGTIAIESGSEYVQKNIINKNCDLKKARNVIDLLKSKGIMVRCFFILGFPTETKTQMQETVDYARSLGADWCVFMIAMPLVGTKMFDQFLKMGVIQDTPELWGETVFDERTFDTPEISAKELNEFEYRANLDCNFINNPNILSGQFKKAINIFEDIIIRFPFHIIAHYLIAECYTKLGEIEKARQKEDDLRLLIKTDKRATDMFAKYNDLMKTFHLY